MPFRAMAKKTYGSESELVEGKDKKKNAMMQTLIRAHVTLALKKEIVMLQRPKEVLEKLKEICTGKGRALKQEAITRSYAATKQGETESLKDYTKRFDLAAKKMEEADLEVPEHLLVSNILSGLHPRHATIVIGLSMGNTSASSFKEVKDKLCDLSMSTVYNNTTECGLNTSDWGSGDGGGRGGGRGNWDGGGGRGNGGRGTWSGGRGNWDNSG